MSSETNETTPVLSEGSIKLLHTSRFDNLQVFNKTQHTLQLLSIKKIITNRNLPESCYYRVIICDGEHYMMAMLATRFNGMVDDGSIKGNCIVVVDWLACFNSNVPQKILLILSLRVVAYPEARIGEPKQLERGLNNIPPRMNGRHGNIYPIEALTPYHRQYWKIKARLTYKSDVHQHQSEISSTTTTASSKSFKLTLTDDTGSIEATVIDEAGLSLNRPLFADSPLGARPLTIVEIHTRLKQGQVYYISGGQVHFMKGSSDRVDVQSAGRGSSFIPGSSSPFINEYEVLLKMGVFTFEECLEEEERGLIESRESSDVACVGKRARSP